MIDLVEGWTGNIDYQLKADGAVYDLSLASSVEMVLHDRIGTLLTPAGTFSVTDASNGKVRYAPGSTSEITVAAAPYSFRVKVTQASKIVYFPNGEAEKWIVRRS